MSAGRFDIEIEKGADFTLNLDYKDSNDTTVDLSTFSARMQIRESSGGALICWGGSADADKPADDTEELGSSDSKRHLALATMGDTVPNISFSISSAKTKLYTESQFEGAVYSMELYQGTTGSETSLTRVMDGGAHLIPRVIQ
jgi:hypothetical protein